MLPGNEVTKADGCESYDVEIETVHETPAFNFQLRHSPKKDKDQEENEAHGNTFLIQVRRLDLTASLQQFVLQVQDPFAHRLKKQESDRNAKHGVEYAEDLASCGDRSTVAVSWRSETKEGWDSKTPFVDLQWWRWPL